MRLIFILFLVSVTACSKDHQEMTMNNLKKIEVIKLPNELDTRLVIDTEQDFDSSFNDKKDTIFHYVDNFKLNLGARLTEYEYVDIRTKVVFTSVNGDTKTVFIDGNGLISIDNKVFEGSRKLMKLLRKE